MKRPHGSRIGLWIDKELDCGHDLAEEICPEVISLRDINDPRQYAIQNGKVLGVSLNGIVIVPEHLEELAIEAAEEQPEKNIYLEYVKVVGDKIVGFYESDGSITRWERMPSNLPYLGVLN